MNSVAYTGLLATFLFELIVSNKMYSIVTLSVWYDLFNIPMSLLLGYSMYKIKNYTRKLRQNGMFANEKLMIFHVMSYGTATLINSSKNILIIIDITNSPPLTLE